MTATQIAELAEEILVFLKGQDKKAALTALGMAIDAIHGDESTAAVVD